MIRIIIVEDQKITLSSLEVLLNGIDHIQVVAQAASAAELFDLLDKKNKVDLILSDILMPKMDGITMITELKLRNINIPVILLSMLEDEKHSSSAFIVGAKGYLSKNVEVDELIFAINTVRKGRRYFESELCISLLERYHKQLINFQGDTKSKVSLSQRELSVLELIAEGRTNQQMADELFLSRRTVEGIRQGILERTASKNTAALIKFAILNGYLAAT
jgi:DNA-binding NarL/FixJ family response regulator